MILYELSRGSLILYKEILFSFITGPHSGPALIIALHLSVWTTMKDIVQLMSSDETLLALAGRVQIRSQLEVSTVSIPHPPAAPCRLLPGDGD